MKPQQTRDFNMANPLNMRGKNHRSQSTSNFTMIGVRTNANDGGLQEVEGINLQWKTLTGLNDPYRFGLSLPAGLSYASSEVGLYLVHNEFGSSINTPGHGGARGGSGSGGPPCGAQGRGTMLVMLAESPRGGTRGGPSCSHQKGGVVHLVTAEWERCRVPRSGIVRPGRERRDEIDPTR
jgi:hypothetical protein